MLEIIEMAIGFGIGWMIGSFFDLKRECIRLECELKNEKLLNECLNIIYK